MAKATNIEAATITDDNGEPIMYEDDRGTSYAWMRIFYTLAVNC